MTGPEPAEAADGLVRVTEDSAEPWDSWPPWLKRDGTGGVPHCRPDGPECRYLAYIACGKCGWVDPDKERVQRVTDLLEAARLVAAPRTFVIDLPAGEPILTANHRLHKFAANRRTQDLAGLMIRLCRDVHRLPRLEAVRVDLEYASPPRRKADRHPRASDRVEDHDALYPTRKALADGIVRAGVLVDDNKARVRGGECRILPETHPMGQVRVVITEVPGGDL